MFFFLGELWLVTTDTKQNNWAQWYTTMYAIAHFSLEEAIYSRHASWTGSWMTVLLSSAQLKKQQGEPAKDTHMPQVSYLYIGYSPMTSTAETITATNRFSGPLNYTLNTFIIV